MNVQILMSIHPEYVKSILCGVKRFEYRKIRCRLAPSLIIIYATAPVKRIVAEVSVSAVLEGTLETVWSTTKDYAGISYGEYKKYFAGSKTAIAYKLGVVRKYDVPKPLSDYGLRSAPQAFLYYFGGNSAHENRP